MTETPNIDQLDESLATADQAIDDAQTSAAAIREKAESIAPETGGALLGCSMSRWDHKSPQIYLARCYSREDVTDAVTNYGARVLLYNVATMASASTCRTECQWAMNTYGPGKGTVELVVMMRGNEIDLAIGTNQSSIDQWCNTADEAQAAIGEVEGCLHGINLTGNGIRNTGNAAKFKPSAPFVDVFVANTYPPGRKQNPPLYNPYPDFIDECIEIAVDWGVPAWAVGEWGIPIHPNDASKRPDYVAGGARYMRDKCAELGLVFIGASYWDSVKLKNNVPDPNEPDNRFQTDGSQTADAWYAALS